MQAYQRAARRASIFISLGLLAVLAIAIAQARGSASEADRRILLGLAQSSWQEGHLTLENSRSETPEGPVVFGEPLVRGNSAVLSFAAPAEGSYGKLEFERGPFGWRLAMTTVGQKLRPSDQIAFRASS